MSLTVLVIALGGCSTRSTNYVDALHRSWTDISRAVREDGSLRQCDMNTGSGIAVILAREEATYWSCRLAEKGLAIPGWEKKLRDIAKSSNEFDGGSAAPMSKNLEMLEYLDVAIKEMRAVCFACKR